MRVHFSGQPDRFQRMRNLWNAPLVEPSLADRALGVAMVPVIVLSLLLLLSGLWLCAKVGWIEER